MADDSSAAWFKHVALENGGREYPITIRCTGHRVGARSHRMRLGVAVLDPYGWRIGDRGPSSTRLEVLSDISTPPKVERIALTGVEANPPDRINSHRFLLESPVQASPQRPWRARHPEQLLRERTGWACPRCKDNVTVRDHNRLEMALDLFAEAGIHTVHLNELRAALHAIPHANPVTTGVRVYT